MFGEPLWTAVSLWDMLALTVCLNPTQTCSLGTPHIRGRDMACWITLHVAPFRLLAVVGSNADWDSRLRTASVCDKYHYEEEGLNVRAATGCGTWNKAKKGRKSKPIVALTARQFPLDKQQKQSRHDLERKLLPAPSAPSAVGFWSFNVLRGCGLVCPGLR